MRRHWVKGMKTRNKKKTNRLRPLVQFFGALCLSLNLPGFITGKMYTGPLKGVCVPGLNCSSCPGALGACPIGSLQSSLATIGGKISYYVAGLLILFGVTLGRFFCGWICPFGWLQELLHKIPVKKCTVPLRIDRPLRWMKYVILLVFVIGLPLLLRTPVGMSAPYFCKWICPAGTLEGGVSLALANGQVRSSLGGMFLWKACVLIAVLAACLVIYRPFCKYVCPLGAFYGLFSRFALYRYALEASACTGCGACKRNCPMGVDPVKNPNDAECIRCGDCIKTCPHGALHVCGKKKAPIVQQSEGGTL